MPRTGGVPRRVVEMVTAKPGQPPIMGAPVGAELVDDPDAPVEEAASSPRERTKAELAEAVGLARLGGCARLTQLQNIAGARCQARWSAWVARREGRDA